MPVTNYYTVDAEIIGESAGGVEINYAKDALGSVVGTLVGDTLQNSYAYKPYGALLSKTGAGPDPKFQWVGTQGYRPTSRRQSDYYIRARHYGSQAGMWTSVDPLWPQQPPLVYGSGSPTTCPDPTGEVSFGCHWPRRLRQPVAGDCRSWDAPEVRSATARIHPRLDAKLRWYIEHDACCRELAERRVFCGTFRGPQDLVFRLLEPEAYENSLRQRLYDMVYRSLVCAMCMETRLDPQFAFRHHKSKAGNTAAGLFGFNDPTRRDYGIDLDLESQLRAAARMFCREICKRRGGCDCEPRAEGRAGLPYPSGSTKITNWDRPSNKWPYMPNGIDEAKKRQKFLDCVYGKGAYRADDLLGPSPPVPW